MLTLRPKQVTGLQNIAAAFREHMSVLFVGPTGFGKTVVFSEIARRAAASPRVSASAYKAFQMTGHIPSFAASQHATARATVQSATRWPCRALSS